MRLRWHTWRERRLTKRLKHHVFHRILLTPVVDPPFRQEFGSVVISGMPDLEAGDPREVELVTFDTPHLEVVPDPDMDAPDTPEADHAFWEQTAEDVLEGYQPWRDDPLHGG